jgi:putative transposase
MNCPAKPASRIAGRNTPRPVAVTAAAGPAPPSDFRRLKWLGATGAKTLYIEPGSPWENGYCESFSSKLRDEFLNGGIFYSMKEIRVLAERWRVHYNTVRPHSSRGYRPPAPRAWITTTLGYGEVESKVRLPLPHTPTVAI